MALGVTQPVTEMSTRNISWGKGSRCVGLTILPPSCADCLEILGASTCWNPKCLSRYWFLPCCLTQLISGLNVIQSVFLPFSLSFFSSYSDIFYLLLLLHLITLNDTNGRTPLDEWSASLRDLYLTTHDTHKRQTSMPPGKTGTCNHKKRALQPILYRAATGIGGIIWSLCSISITSWRGQINDYDLV